MLVDAMELGCGKGSPASPSPGPWQVWHLRTPQPVVHPFSIHLLGGYRWDAEITQQGSCLPEPSGPKSGLGKRQVPPTA